jgi:hypothetical protein
MKNSLFFWFFLFLICSILVTRPAHASGTVASSSSLNGYSTSVQIGTSCGSSSSPITTDAINSCYMAFFDTAGFKSANENPSYTPYTYSISNTPTSGSGSFVYNQINRLGGSSQFIGSWNYTGTSVNCPPNSSGSSTCTCIDPYIPNSGANACVLPACPATGASFSSGYYDLGTVDNSNNHPVLSSCDSGCSTSYTGSAQSYRALVNGVYHYYSKGSYANDSTINAGVCSGGFVSPSSTSVLPPSTCAPGQSAISDSSGNL